MLKRPVKVGFSVGNVDVFLSGLMTTASSHVALHRVQLVGAVMWQWSVFFAGGSWRRDLYGSPQTCDAERSQSLLIAMPTPLCAGTCDAERSQSLLVAMPTPLCAGTTRRGQDRIRLFDCTAMRGTCGSTLTVCARGTRSRENITSSQLLAIIATPDTTNMILGAYAISAGPPYGEQEGPGVSG